MFVVMVEFSLQEGFTQAFRERVRRQARDSLELEPDCVAGHSFGEIMALHAAGALDAEAAIGLARARGEAMARAAGTTSGGMLAVFAERGLVDDYLAGRSSELVLANDNAPDQVILSHDNFGHLMFHL